MTNAVCPFQDCNCEDCGQIMQAVVALLGDLGLHSKCENVLHSKDRYVNQTHFPFVVS